MKEAAVFLTEKDIQKAVRKLAEEIDGEYQNKAPPLVLAVSLKGGLFFAADLIRLIRFPTVADFVSIAGEENAFYISKDISAKIQGRHVLIVKDILNTGRKVLFLKKRLLASDPASVKTVVLLDKAARRSADIRPDFRGFSIDDRYVFGYGMDHEGRRRQLRDIYHFTQ